MTPHIFVILSVQHICPHRGKEYTPCNAHMFNQRIGRNPLANMLGTASNAGNSHNFKCNHVNFNEQTVFESECVDTISEMNSALNRLHGYRAAAFVFTGRSQWGWGNILPAIYALHWICKIVDRYCYIRIMDHTMGHVFNYANGKSWHYSPSVSRIYNNVKHITEKEPWTNPRELYRLKNMLKNSNASLVEIKFEKLMWLSPNRLSSVFGT
jgi:hypothetical protein